MVLRSYTNTRSKYEYVFPRQNTDIPELSEDEKRSRNSGQRKRSPGHHEAARAGRRRNAARIHHIGHVRNAGVIQSPHPADTIQIRTHVLNTFGHRKLLIPSVRPRLYCDHSAFRVIMGQIPPVKPTVTCLPAFTHFAPRPCHQKMAPLPPFSTLKPSFTWFLFRSLVIFICFADAT